MVFMRMLKPATAVWKIIVLSVVATFVVGLVCLDLCRVKQSDASVPGLPPPGEMLAVSKSYSLPVLKGLRLDSDNPLHIDFIIDSGNEKNVSQEDVSVLIRYFLAALTVPQSALWVNLSPYESDRVIDESLGITDLGRDMLAQDYVLKQLASSLTHPDTETGRAYWHALSGDGGNAQSFSKIWIVPDKAEVYESGTTAVITEASLQVMTERDYSAYAQQSVHDSLLRMDGGSLTGRNVLLPEITRDVNQGKNFARLRQMYHAILLGLWFKHKFVESFYSAYLDKSKVSGIDISDKTVKDKIYRGYVKAFERGVYDVLRVDSGEIRSQGKKMRRYFSGGVEFMHARAENLTQKVSRELMGEILTAEGTFAGSALTVGIDMKSVPFAASAVAETMGISIFENKEVMKNLVAQERQYVTAMALINDAANEASLDMSWFFDPEKIADVRSRVQQMLSNDYRLLNVMSVMDEVTRRITHADILRQAARETAERNGGGYNVDDYHLAVRLIDILELQFLPDDMPVYRVITDEKFAGFPGMMVEGVSFWGVNTWVAELFNREHRPAPIMTRATLGLLRAHAVVINDPRHNRLQSLAAVHHNPREAIPEVKLDTISSSLMSDTENPQHDEAALRAGIRRVRTMLSEGGVLELVDRIMTSDPEYGAVTIAGETLPSKKLVALTRGVGDIVKKAAGHNFDLVIYPASGADALSPAAYARNIITVDPNDIFAVSSQEDDSVMRARLMNVLFQKFGMGINFVDAEQNMTYYAIDLALLGADPDSLRVIERDEAHGLTVLEFSVDGQVYRHTHVRRLMPEKLDPENAKDAFLIERLRASLKDARHPVLLSRAAVGKPVTQAMYPLLPDVTTVVSDTGAEMSYIKGSGKLGEQLDLKTPDIMKALHDLLPVHGAQNIPAYGYVDDLRDLSIFKLAGEGEQAGSAVAGEDFVKGGINLEGTGVRVTTDGASSVLKILDGFDKNNFSHFTFTISTLKEVKDREELLTFASQ
jgi:hypothetical protein